MTEAAVFRHWRLERDVSEVAWLWIDCENEAVNSLGSAVLEELEQIVDALEQSPPAALVLISAKSSGFIAGADIREFDRLDNLAGAQASARRVHQLFNRIEALPCTSVAAIDGFCLGGGLELALACDYRVATERDATRIGFPEVQLGIYPGFGGTARSIERIGGRKAMTLMLGARLLSAGAARSMGLVDELVPAHGSLRWAARNAALKGRHSKPCPWTERLTSAPGVRHILAALMRRTVAQKVHRHQMPAPYVLIDTWQAAGSNKARLLEAEARQVPELLFGDTSTNLRRVFRLQERLKTQGGSAGWRGRRVHVVGAGVMGGDIAAWCALKGLEVTLQDREQALVEPALKRAEALFRRRLKSAAAVEAARGRLVADVAGTGVARADIIIEAIFENLDAKQALFAALEARARADAVLATNTSAIALEKIAAAMRSPSRLVGVHFFNPVAQMPLVEVVAGAASEAEALQRACQFANAIGKLPLPVRSSPGFLVNRVLGPYMLAALRASADGVALETIDAAAQWFGMPVGPVELADTVGLDVAISVARELAPDNTEAIARLQSLVEAGRLGKKSGQGFYRWKNGKARKRAVPGNVQLDALGERLIAPLVEECRRCVQEGVVADADLADAGVIFGTGFAPFRGGPLHYADSLERAK